MVEENVNVASFLSRATEQEKEYDWLGAAKTYSEMLSKEMPENLLTVGSTYEEMAHALYRSALQADNVGMFRERLGKSLTCYEKARANFEKSRRDQSQPFVLRCKAMIALLGYWQETKASEKKRWIAETWSSTKEALEGFKRSGNLLEFCRTLNLLSFSAIMNLCYESKSEPKEMILRDCIQYCETAIALPESAADVPILAKSYVDMSGFLTWFATDFPAETDNVRVFNKAYDYWLKAIGYSEESAFLQTMVSFMFSGFPAPDVASVELTRTVFKGLSCCKKSGDRLATGIALDWLAQRHYISALQADNFDEVEGLAKKAYEYEVAAQDELSRIAFALPGMAVVHSQKFHSAHFAWLSIFQRDPKKKRELAERAVQLVPEFIATEEDAGYPDSIADAHWIAGKAITELAKTESDVGRRKALLTQAVEHEKAYSLHMQQSHPLDAFVLGAGENILADTESELGRFIDDQKERLIVLRAAADRKKRALDLTLRGLTYSQPDSRMNAMVALWQSEYAARLCSVCDISGDQNDCKNAIEAYETAAQSYQKAQVPSRSAECYWQAARIRDSLAEYPKSADGFSKASELYKAAGDKIPQLHDFYYDYSGYMSAWREIENARHYHARQESRSSEEHYEKAAYQLRSTRGWAYLASNYSAWARIEIAEHLSQQEKSREAIEALQEAERLFKESEERMRAHSNKTESESEKEMISRLLGAADARQQFCKARVALEEARLRTKEDEISVAAEMYGHAAEMFADVRKQLTSDQDRKEVDLIIALTRAWRAMSKAEADSSPELYQEAASIFEEAKNLSSGDKAKNLATGHSRFCKALEAGCRFSITGDIAQHNVAADNLDSAAIFYLKAGLENAAEYARASKLLFDAYAQMSKATREEDHDKKAKFYALAERILESSASSFEKAEQPGKKGQVLKLLNRVRQDKELAVSLTEVLHAPDAVSATMVFSSPTPTHEAAVGLDRFEHADVQATLIVKPKELLVDQALTLEIELVNAGRGVAQLTKVDKVIPEGFEIAEEPQKYHIEDSYLNMKGRRLDALKTEDVKLSLKPKSKGQFTVKPRIMYLDESGKYKSFELDPVVVTVKELGISGWLKGSEKKK